MNRSTALVTGASSGIGLEIARLLAADGHDLIVTARSGDRLQELAASLREGAGIDCRVVPGDLAAPDAVHSLCEVLEDMEAEIDILVNNAGFGLQGGFLEGDLDRQLAMMRLNMTALTELSWRLGRPMAERGRGRILNVASTAAFVPGPWMAVHYATKAYVLSFSEALSVELADRGVTVTALCPGPTSTGFQEAAEMEGVRLLRSGTMDAATVARAGHAAMMAGRRRAVPGLSNRFSSILVRLLPRSWVLRVVAGLNSR